MECVQESAVWLCVDVADAGARVWAVCGLGAVSGRKCVCAYCCWLALRGVVLVGVGDMVGVAFISFQLLQPM